MSQTLTIARRELSSLFYSPIAYVVIALFAIGSTLIFFMGFAPGYPASMRSTYQGVIWLMIFLVPAISMRLLSEEYRAGTIESLMTSPISDAQVVIGKWLGAMGFFVALTTPMWIHIFVLELNGDLDWGPIITGYLGLLLVGSLYLAIGTFASATTQNQIIAFLVTMAMVCALTFLTYYLPQAQFIGDAIRDVLYFTNINLQFEDFNKGLIDTSNIVYFLAGTVLFLFFAVLLLQSRRWR